MGLDLFILMDEGLFYPFWEPFLFSAVASDFQEGTLNELVRLDENNERRYDFALSLLGASGNTGLQIQVEGAKMDSEAFAQSIGDFGSIDANLSFSMSDMSGLKLSTPPLIVNQPVGAANPTTISVQATEELLLTVAFIMLTALSMSGTRTTL